MIIRVDPEAFDAIKKLCDLALRAAGLQCRHWVNGILDNILMEVTDDGQATKDRPQDLQEKANG